jgi:peptide/nickel transport system permease protein
MSEAVAVTPPRVRRLNLFRSRRGLLGISILGTLLLLVALGPLLAPHDPTATSGNTGAAPSSAHLLGTDTVGRDILSRVLTGGGTVIVLPLIAVTIALTIGATIGILAGYLGGLLDAVATSMFDVQLAIPGILLALLVITGFGRGDAAVVAAVALVEVPRFARVLRSATQSVAARDYVLAAKARGEGVRWITFGEILPGVFPTFLTEAALGLSTAVLAIASLSFLGLGVQEPTPNWAVMVSENRSLLFTHPFGGVIVPALLIALLAIGVNLTADALTRSRS